VDHASALTTAADLVAFAAEMSAWTPIPEIEIWEMMNAAWDRMSLAQRRLWEVIRIDPVKWQQEPYGTQGGGFWVVGIYGQKVIWYNDIEGGFNRSRWSTPGRLDEYWCNQDQLEWTVQHVINEIADGHVSGGIFGPPQNI
jgi:hypothetical protein